MYLTFLDYEAKKKSMRKKNRKMIKILNQVAEKYKNEIKFATVNVRKYEDKMNALGLYGGIDAVPCSAINVDGGKMYPLDQINNKKNVMNKVYISNFINEFLAGRIKPMGLKKQQETAKIINKRINDKKLKKKEKKNVDQKKKIKYRKGIREKYGGKDDDIIHLSRMQSDGNDDGKTTTIDTFKKIALDETKDVLILFHDSRPDKCIDCEYLAPYYKKLARRFKDLKIPSVVIARFDVGNEPAPANINAQISASNKLPMIFLFKAFNKNPPFLIYSGAAKVRPMMDWLHKNAGIKFDLPELAQFDEVQKEKFKDQVEMLYGGGSDL